MVIAFQVILFILIGVFGLGLLADDFVVSSDQKNRFLSIVLAAIIALSASFFV